MRYRGLKDTYTLENVPFAKGGEGNVFNIVGNVRCVAKIYHADRITNALEEKLRVMVSRPPAQKVLSQVAWPLDVLFDSGKGFCGFVMPSLPSTRELTNIYTYPAQSSISVEDKLIVAQNICAVIAAVHQAGYVFGDFNPRNIGVDTKTGQVAFFDTDSYHIYDPASGKTYRCGVGFDGYIAPELLKTCEGIDKSAYLTAPLPTFTVETDNFALAIHIFKLLMNGYTPFNGVNENASLSSSSASPGRGNDAIKRDSYCFKAGNRPQSVAVPPLQVLPKSIGELFNRAFILGRVKPELRPTAVEWYSALENYESLLKPCTKKTAHQYLKTLPCCPWCVADEQYAASLRKPSTAILRQKNFAAAPLTVPSVSNSPVRQTPSSNVNAINIGARPQPNINQQPQSLKPGKNYERNAVWDVILSMLKGFGIGYLVMFGIYVITLGGLFLELIDHGLDMVASIPIITAVIGFGRGIWRNTNK